MEHGSKFSKVYRGMWLGLLVAALAVGVAVGAGVIAGAAGMMALLGTMVLGLTLLVAGRPGGLKRRERSAGEGI
jgi:hypothetical protein